MRRIAVVVLSLLGGGCPLGPDYARPKVPMTGTFRGQDQAEAASFADLPWWEVFHDPALNALLTEALANSYDLQDAVARVEVAAENAHIATDQLMPALSIQVAPSYQQVFSGFASGFTIPGVPASALPSGNFRFASYLLQGSLSWEADVWGRLRRLRQSALAEFLASEDNRRGVIVSLIGNVAQGYFTLLALDLQLDIARRTVESRQQTLALFKQREAGGVGDALDTTSEEAILANARAIIPALERQIVQTENQIAYVIGRAPGPIRRTADVLDEAPSDHPVGLPAALLERRPDVRQAEANLVAANAQVGAAFAAMFPTFTVSGSGGVQSDSLSTLFTGGAAIFSVGLFVNWIATILNGAQYRHRYRAQQANYRVVLADFRRAVLNALQDVSNALVAIRTFREQRAQLEIEVRAQTERVRLAKLRFQNGVASYLDVVQAEQNLFPAQLALAQTIGAQFVSMAQLYRALGGGWKVPPSTEKTPQATKRTP
jgi:multidrug efflux system outer membrane protein